MLVNGFQINIKYNNKTIKITKNSKYEYCVK